MGLSVKKEASVEENSQLRLSRDLARHAGGVSGELKSSSSPHHARLFLTEQGLCTADQQGSEIWGLLLSSAVALAILSCPSVLIPHAQWRENREVGMLILCNAACAFYPEPKQTESEHIFFLVSHIEESIL